MAVYTPQQFAQASRLMVPEMTDIAEGIVRGIAVRSGGRAVNRPHMRIASVTASRARRKRRRPGDPGPLRIITGTHARATKGGPHTFAPGSVERLERQGPWAVLKKGSNALIDPGVYNETGAVVKNGWGRGIRIEIPKRAALAPASKIESRKLGWAAKFAKRKMIEGMAARKL